MMRPAPGVWMLVAASLVVGAAVALGLLTIGGPKTARLEKLDQERHDDLSRIQRALEREEPLPPSLDHLDPALPEDARTDPATGQPYAYRVLSDSTYELCATFALGSDALLPRPAESSLGAYEAGRHCFVVERETPR